MKYLILVTLLTVAGAVYAETASTDTCTDVPGGKCDAPKKVVGGVCTDVDASGNPVVKPTGATEN